MRRTPLLGEVDDAAVEAFATSGVMQLFRKGTYLLHQGDEGTDVFFLWRGRIELSSVSSTGHRQLHTRIDPPQFFGEFSVLGQMPRSVTALALEDSEVWVVPGDRYLGFLETEPAASRAMLRVLARQIHAHEAFVEDLLHLDLKGRVAKRLLSLVTASFEDLPPDGAIVPSIVTHADLASLSGGSRENVTRILSEFQRRGLVARDGRRYVLRDIRGLARLAGL
ncbi:MAG TPA: Crp/Fnr family transcriptional regulator [Actinomycetota bacterium]|nr:Crp/Fnr family transcriptional regulator [Actinomycetota bacterium]